MEEIAISTPTINLDQLLKWQGIADTGGQAKHMIEEGLVSINKITATERRKKIHPGDEVEVKGVGIWKVVLDQEI